MNKKGAKCPTLHDDFQQFVKRASCNLCAQCMRTFVSKSNNKDLFGSDSPEIFVWIQHCVIITCPTLHWLKKDAFERQSTTSSNHFTAVDEWHPLLPLQFWLKMFCSAIPVQYWCGGTCEISLRFVPSVHTCENQQKKQIVSTTAYGTSPATSFTDHINGQFCTFAKVAASHRLTCELWRVRHLHGGTLHTLECNEDQGRLLLTVEHKLHDASLLTVQTRHYKVLV